MLYLTPQRTHASHNLANICDSSNIIQIDHLFMNWYACNENIFLQPCSATTAGGGGCALVTSQLGQDATSSPAVRSWLALPRTEPKPHKATPISKFRKAKFGPDSNSNPLISNLTLFKSWSMAYKRQNAQLSHYTRLTPNRMFQNLVLENTSHEMLKRFSDNVRVSQDKPDIPSTHDQSTSILAWPEKGNQREDEYTRYSVRRAKHAQMVEHKAIAKTRFG